MIPHHKSRKEEKKKEKKMVKSYWSNISSLAAPALRFFKLSSFAILFRRGPTSKNSQTHSKSPIALSCSQRHDVQFIKPPHSALTKLSEKLKEIWTNITIIFHYRHKLRNQKSNYNRLSEKEQLRAGLQQEQLPRHVAIIMDGNGRWAEKRGLPTSMGHIAGATSFERLIQTCYRWRIPILTVFAFSQDNIRRPKVEVDSLMMLFERQMQTHLESWIRDGIRVSFIGDMSKLSLSLQNLKAEVEEKTKNNLNLHLVIAIMYSGKYDVLQACKRIAKKVVEGQISLDEINEDLAEKELETNCVMFPSPDLIIRTGGDFRISNFLLWQSAYSELYFAEMFWPDFGEEDFVAALNSFQQRNRRYGGRNSN